jgi:hypothetical protein
MTRLLRLALILVLASLAGACASAGADIKTETLLDPKANLAGYKTYAWVASVQILKDDQGQWAPVGFDLDAELRSLINRELGEHGLAFAEANPDLLVGYVMVIDTAAQLAELKQRYGEDIDISNRHEGGLLVALVDAQTGKAVWVGAATAQLKQKRSDAEARERLGIAMDKLFEALPR